MKNVVLYLDSLTEPMEQLAIASFPAPLQLKFLHPKIGEQGNLEEAGYILATHAKVGRDIIDAAPNLKLIQRTGVGYDSVDIDYAKKKSIPVSITFGSNSSSVAELVFLFILSLYRKLVVLNAQSKAGIWDNMKYRHQCFEIFGKTVGVIGAGAIGKDLMKRLKAFGADLVYSDVRRLDTKTESELGASFMELSELLKTSDIITLHIPWCEANRGLIGNKEFTLMKKGALLINTARGPIVDQKALVAALREGRLAGAGLDVFDPEPFTSNDDILQFDNVMTTPHVGAATWDNFKRAYNFCAENVRRLERGEKAKYIVNDL